MQTTRATRGRGSGGLAGWRWGALWVLSCLLGVSAPAHASDLYAKGLLGGAYAQGTPSGSFNIIGPGGAYEYVGDDGDSGLLYGVGIGLEVPLPEVFPWDMGLPPWSMRFESELLGPANFDFRNRAQRLSDGAILPDPFFSSIDAVVTWLNGAWLDAPVYRPIAKLFKPFPVLKPVTLGVGLGLGMSYVELDTYIAGVRSAGSSVNFAWQAGTELSYALTDQVAVSLGYRYRNFGKTATTIEGSGIDPNTPSVLDMKLESHGFDAGLRVKFWSTDFPGSLWRKLLR